MTKANNISFEQVKRAMCSMVEDNDANRVVKPSLLTPHSDIKQQLYLLGALNMILILSNDLSSGIESFKDQYIANRKFRGSYTDWADDLRQELWHETYYITW